MKILARFVSILLYDWLILVVLYFIDAFDILEIPFKLLLNNRVATVLSFFLAISVIILSAFLINKKYKIISSKLFVISQLVFLFSLTMLLYRIFTAIRYAIMGFQL